jgi:hypothetical protein
MKYVISWKRRRHGTTASYDAAEARLDGLLTLWDTSGEGVVIHHAWCRTHDSGGYLMVETEDSALIENARDVLADFNFHIDPVRDRQPSGAVQAWRLAV